MRFLVAVIAVLPFALVITGLLTGRVRARSCCSVDAARDVRLREERVSD